jgi:hypothetical protein
MTKRKQAGGSLANPDAVQLLTEDHKKVKKLFKDFERIKDRRARQRRNQPSCSRSAWS